MSQISDLKPLAVSSPNPCITLHASTLPLPPYAATTLNSSNTTPNPTVTPAPAKHATSNVNSSLDALGSELWYVNPLLTFCHVPSPSPTAVCNLKNPGWPTSENWKCEKR